METLIVFLWHMVEVCFTGLIILGILWVAFLTLNQIWNVFQPNPDYPWRRRIRKMELDVLTLERQQEQDSARLSRLEVRLDLKGVGSERLL